MEINLKLEQLVRGLLKNGQQIKNVDKYFYDVILRWHHPNKLIHSNTIYLVRRLKDFFEELNSDKNDIIHHLESLNYLNSISEIEDFSNSLHDVMFCYLEYSNEIGYEPLEEYFNNYKYIRNFLNKLKIIEHETNSNRVVKNLY